MRIYQSQQSKLKSLKDDIAEVIADQRESSTHLMQDAGNLKSKIDKLIQDNMAAVNQRTKYLVAQSRGIEAYRVSFNESLLET